MIADRMREPLPHVGELRIGRPGLPFHQPRTEVVLLHPASELVPERPGRKLEELAEVAGLRIEDRSLS
jgi:hypothetical protein